jgi:hypothetical protein
MFTMALLATSTTLDTLSSAAFDTSGIKDPAIADRKKMTNNAQCMEVMKKIVCRMNIL